VAISRDEFVFDHSHNPVSAPLSYPAHRLDQREAKGDQLIYVIEGKATCRVSGKECEIKAGDFVTIPAGAPHTLRTGAEKLFAVTVFAPPEA
jgi:quercetin dioxygenase-like cupin family protein